MKDTLNHKSISNKQIALNRLEREIRLLIQREVRHFSSRKTILKKCKTLYDKYIKENIDFDNIQDISKDYENSFKYSVSKIIERERRNYTYTLILLFTLVSIISKNKSNIDNINQINKVETIHNKLYSIVKNGEAIILEDEELDLVLDLGKKIKDFDNVILKEELETYLNKIKKSMQDSSTIEFTTSETNLDGTNRRTMNLNAKLALDFEYNVKQAQIEEYKKKGIYYWTSQHLNSSERCKSYQGRLFNMFLHSINSNFETGEVIDGNIVLSFNDVINQVDKYGYKNNIIVGFNCKHHLVKYENGSKPPEMVDTGDEDVLRSKIYKRNKIEQHIKQKLNAYYLYPNEEDKKEIDKVIRQYKRYCELNEIDSREYMYTI